MKASPVLVATTFYDEVQSSACTPTSTQPKVIMINITLGNLMKCISFLYQFYFIGVWVLFSLPAYPYFIGILLLLEL
jgi:hypothetical protein